MLREIEPRAPERERAEPSRGSRAGMDAMSADGPEQSSDPLTRDLDLPRERSRERILVEGREYRLSGDDVRALAAVGAFRVVATDDLRPRHSDTPSRPPRALERLEEAGLLRTTPCVVGRNRTTVVTLTSEARELLESHRREGSGHPRQAFYAGVAKPRELAHDSRLYEAYLKAEERLATTGSRVRRVVLEEELKGNYQRFLQEGNRSRRDSDGKPTRDPSAVETWAERNHLPCRDGHVEFPDVRLEIEDRDGRLSVEDLEVLTPHYRGAHAAAKASAGFTRYRALGARIGGAGGGRKGSGGRSPRLAEEMLR